MAEDAIKSLQATANRLISEQNSFPKSQLNIPEKELNKQSKKVNKAPSVIKSIGVGGTSIFSAEITRKPEDEVAPHKVLIKEEGLKDKDEIKDDQWFNMYGQLVT